MPLSLEVHRAFLSGSVDQMADELEAEGLADLSIPKSVWELRHGQLEKNPDHSPWLLRAMVLKDTRQVVGNIGFHGTPEVQANLIEEFGGIEFGYSVIEQFRRQGYAREACEGIMNWAGQVADIPNFILSIALDNEASIATAERLGFTKQSEYMHPERGREWLYVRGVEAT